MTRGWVALLLWLALPIYLAVLASRGVRRARSRWQAQLIPAGFSAVVGTMIAMYTVWFGFVYAQLFMIVLALTVNATQAALHPGRRGPPAISPLPDRSIAMRRAASKRSVASSHV